MKNIVEAVTPYQCEEAKFDSYVDNMDIASATRCLGILEPASLQAIDQLF